MTGYTWSLIGVSAVFIASLMLNFVALKSFGAIVVIYCILGYCEGNNILEYILILNLLSLQSSFVLLSVLFSYVSVTTHCATYLQCAWNSRLIRT